jgi:predicted Zn-ribbon and HTH transcriptional regulator
MTYCSNCGNELDVESNFCQKCGVRTEKGVKEDVAIPWASDPNWRKEIDTALQKASKAVDDGVKILQETFKDVAEEVEKEAKSVRTNFKEKIGPVFCRNCGTENTKYAKFCTKCGKEL